MSLRNLLGLAAVFFVTATAFGREIEFSWGAMVGALKYEIQVGTDEKLATPLSSALIDQPSYHTQLPVGRYFYRVRVIDQKNKPGKWSKPEVVTIAPYAPELVEPKDASQYSYYEIEPDLAFSWKPTEGKNEYEIIIYKTTGEKILESKVKGTDFKTSKVGEGEYLWKVRTVTEQGLVSEYSEPRHFNIEKKALQKPELLKPAVNGLAPAYRKLEFNWNQDPVTKYTDLTFEKVKGRNGAKPTKQKIENIQGQSYVAPYVEPGEYRWNIVTKEGQSTPGIASDTADFEVRDDVLTGGNYELEFSMSPVDDLYTVSSARQTNGASMVAQQSHSQGLFTGFDAKYYVFSSLGFGVSTRTAKLSVENLSGFEQETDLTLRLRFGAKGFFQEFVYGYRIMDLVEAENTPSVTTTDFTTNGPLLGTRLSATITPGWKTQVNLFYYKPLNNVEGIPNFVGDVYGGSAVIKWNFMYQFWLGYRFAMERINASFQTPGASPSVTASWTQYRTEPFFISISFEH